jgi:hypothetical protein
MAESADLTTMVALKEQHIQSLERELGQLLSKLMPGSANCPESQADAAVPKSKAPRKDTDADQTIFQLTEKVINSFGLKFYVK